MLGNLHNTVKTRWSEFRISISEKWSTLNSGEIRKLSWAKRIESYEAVPDAYQFFLEPFRKQGQEFPYTVLTPTFEGLLQGRTTEKLVCDLIDEIYVLEKVGETVKVYGYPLAEISYVQSRTVLLDSQIKLYGLTQDCIPACVIIKFNTATENLFAPIVEKIRRVAIGPEDSELGFELAKLDSLEKVSYKFMNYARRSLLSGEEILQMILQPKIQIRLLAAFGRGFYRYISPAHLAILTDRELILIHEEDNPRVIGDYGKVYDYIPLAKIVRLSLNGEDSKYIKLVVQLPEGFRIESTYQASAREEINELFSRFASLTGHN